MGIGSMLSSMFNKANSAWNVDAVIPNFDPRVENHRPVQVRESAWMAGACALGQSACSICAIACPNSLQTASLEDTLVYNIYI